MPISVAKPPQDVARLVPDAAGAFPVFAAGLVDVRSEIELAGVAPAPTSWRFVRPGPPPAVVEVPAGGGTPAEGDDRFSGDISRALARAARDARTGSVRFEARLLRVPALKLLALWLHSADAEDLFAAITPGSVRAGRGAILPASRFLEAVSSAAARVESLYAAAEQPDELGS